LASHGVLKPAPSLRKGKTQRDAKMGAFAALAHPADLDLAATWEAQLDVHAIEAALAMSHFGIVDRNLTGGDVIVEALDRGRSRADVCSNAFGVGHVPQQNADGFLHVGFPLT
jgi:hypothetical protein